MPPTYLGYFYTRTEAEAAEDKYRLHVELYREEQEVWNKISNVVIIHNALARRGCPPDVSASIQRIVDVIDE